MEKRNNRFAWGPVLAVGSLWGLSEAIMGMTLRGTCARFITGSVMTGVAIFFFSTAFACSRRIISLFALLLLAIGFKLLDAFLLHLPVLHGAIGNPIFAFYTEVLAFLAVWKILDARLGKQAYGRAILGGLAALIAVNLFPLVKFATGIPACVVPGTNYPLSLYYAPIAVGLSAISCPLGMMAGEKLSRSAITASNQEEKFRLIPILVRAMPLFAVIAVFFLRSH